MRRFMSIGWLVLVCCQTPLAAVHAAEVEIQINNTPAGNDDYLTWAPTFCQARLSNADGASHLVVELSGKPVPAAAGQPGGDVLFAAAQTPWPYNETATQPTLQLDLPGNGDWVPFVIAGEFGKPSTNDKDCVVEARAPGSSTVLGSTAVMVRVRKNGNNLHRVEQVRLVNAFRKFRDEADGYLVTEEMHRLASTSDDEAHSQPAFFPWHRAFLVEVERRLQSIDPTVTLCYWNWDQASPNLFNSLFLGAPGPATGAFSPPTFTWDNPLETHPMADWDTDLPFSSGHLSRNTEDHTRLPVGIGTFRFRRLDDGNADPPNDGSCLVEFADFGPRLDDITEAIGTRNCFSWRAERNAHDLAHAWPCGAGHLTNPNRSACDPMFFCLHSQVDRQWAYWQWKQNRFGVVAGGAITFPAPTHYDRVGEWDDAASGTAWYRGSFLDDGMWPWDGTTGDVSGNPRASRPRDRGVPSDDPINTPNSLPTIPSTPFAASAIANLWPAAATAVRIRDTIDYLGKFKPQDGLGYCYDDVPFK
jgi:tyrosinase